MKKVLLLLSAFGLASLTTAQAQVPTPTRIMPVKELRTGMHGTTYTVLQGSEIVPLDTEILGVAENGLGPGYDLIIGKLVDPKSAVVEAVHGMSGSPLYVDGRLVGALSRRLTQFEKDGHCGFTPIEDMLRIEGPDRKGTFASRPAKPAPASGEPPFAVAGLIRGTMGAASGGSNGSSGFATLGVPLSITGLSAELTGKLLRTFGLEASGWVPVSGGSRSEAGLAKAELKPGSPVAAVLMTGDVGMAGTGTLTWREGNRIVAFGHPMMGVGRSAWGMAPAEIITTIPSYLYPHKLSNTGPIVGTIAQDRLSAVGGVIGQMPPTAPYRIARTEEGKALSPLQGTFIADPDYAPLLLTSAIAAAVASGNEEGRAIYLRARGQVTFRNLPPLDLGGVYSGENGDLMAALSSFVSPLQALYRQNWLKPEVAALDLAVEMEQAPRVWTIRDARLETPEVSLGTGDRRVFVEVVLREVNKGIEERRRIEVPLPAALKGGEIRVRVSGADPIDDAAFSRNVASLNDAAGLVALLNRRNLEHRNDRVYVRLETDAPGRTVSGTEMPSLPPSVLAVMGGTDGGPSTSTAALSQAVWAEGSADLPGVVAGTKVLRLTITP
ncbi:hypothetical protein SAMN05444156_1876 [Verrucomicrobium sp. GAS474]|uniref:hypothetical protein n=1 Tax=Verrucomicrobium sp. GAS474 TaxID=1882831 RepID=UPI00087B36AE|nr:hypothetical protein [Verrucomicrobium sp. GAS474]SDU08607.1 hypothetical protein SAMN05444156_1876 [Verrucomicrobium sp. GAS474]